MFEFIRLYTHGLFIRSQHRGSNSGLIVDSQLVGSQLVGSQLSVGSRLSRAHFRDGCGIAVLQRGRSGGFGELEVEVILHRAISRWISLTITQRCR